MGFSLSGTENAAFYIFRRWFNADEKTVLGACHRSPALIGSGTAGEQISNVCIFTSADAIWRNGASIALPLHGFN